MKGHQECFEVTLCSSLWVLEQDCVCYQGKVLPYLGEVECLSSCGGPEGVVPVQGPHKGRGRHVGLQGRATQGEAQLAQRGAGRGTPIRRLQRGREEVNGRGGEEGEEEGEVDG
jgi:hypothetical protein